MLFVIFPFHLSKVLRLPRKSEARSYEVLHQSRKIILANPMIWCTKMQPLSGNQRPDFLTFLNHVSLALHLPRDMHLCRFSSSAPRLPMFWNCYKTFTFCSLLGRCRIPCACHAKQHLNVQIWSQHVVFSTFWLRNVLRATTVCAFRASQLPKVFRRCCGLYILTWKHASRHSGVHFLSISTSKSAPFVFGGVADSNAAKMPRA